MTRLRALVRWCGGHLELCLVVIIALVAALPLFMHSGLLATRAGGDSPFLIQRTQQLTLNLPAGVFPARWMPDGAYGYGYPFYDFYASLPYYIAALLDLAGLGTLLGIKLTQTLGMLLAALGSYWLARELCPRRWVGLAVSAAYTLAPFHLVNIYVRGDSLGEFYAMAWFPLVLLGIYRLLRLRSAASIACLAAAFTGLVLSHNISALVFTPLALLFLVLAALDKGVPAKPRFLVAGLASLLLGLLLSAWFWLPALREQSLVQLQEQTTGYFSYTGHFRWGNLVQLKPVFDYTVDAGRNPFQMGGWQVILAACGLVSCIWAAVRRKRLVSWQIGALVAFAVYTFLITPYSTWFWGHIPLLPLVQFPWRLLSIQALAIALLLINALEVIPSRAAPAAALPVAAFCLLAAVLGLHPGYLPLTESDITRSRAMLYEVYSGNIGSTVRAEYLPRWTVPRPYISGELLGLPSQPLALEGAFSQASLLQREPHEQTWLVTTTARSLLAFPTTFYPGWQAQVDGALQGVEPFDGLGLIGLRLEEGAHTIKLYFTPTPTRRVTGWVSGVALVGWLALLGYAVITGRRYRCAAVVFACLVLFATWIVWIPHPQFEQAALTGPLVQDFAWAPWLHHEPQGITFGQARLLDYALNGELLPGGTYQLTLAWERPVADTTFTAQLVAATAHLLEPAPVWASDSVPVGQAKMTLQLPPDLPPGLYVLRFSAAAGGAALPASNGQGIELGLLASEPLTVQSAAASTGNEAVLGSYGPPGLPPAISLLGVEVIPVEAEVLEVRLQWRSERQAPLNYQLSLRLKTSDGEQLASRDLPPFAGVWPTTLWRPGELYSDRVLLPVAQDKLNRTEYTLEVVLYDRATLQAVGTAVVAGVTIP